MREWKAAGRAMQERGVAVRPWGRAWSELWVGDREALAGARQRVVPQRALRLGVDVHRERRKLARGEELRERLAASVGRAADKPAHACTAPQSRPTAAYRQRTLGP